LNYKPIEKPKVLDCFFHGEIVDWKFRSRLTPTHGKYAIRFEVVFEDGTVLPQERGGFPTLKQGEKAKEEIIADLHHRTFVCFSVTVKEFLEYWLYYYMLDEKKITYNTYYSYRNIIYNYILPQMGNRKMQSLKRNDLITFFNTIDSPSLLSLAYSVIGSSFKHAKQIHIIRTDMAVAAIKTKRRIETKKLANQPNQPPKKDRVTLTAEQLRNLLLSCKETEPDLFLPLIITATTGCRVSELIALKFQNVNFEEKLLYIRDQLGYSAAHHTKENQENAKQHIRPKSKNGERVCLLPDFVIEEITIAFERYQKAVLQNPDFLNRGYIWFQKDGTPHTRRSYTQPFKRLKQRLHLPTDFYWHDIRHTFSTIMAENQISLKEIAVAMGHGNSMFTWTTYIEKDRIVSNEVTEIFPVIDEILEPEPEIQGICDVVILEEFVLQLTVA